MPAALTARHEESAQRVALVKMVDLDLVLQDQRPLRPKEQLVVVFESVRLDREEGRCPPTRIFERREDVSGDLSPVIVARDAARGIGRYRRRLEEPGSPLAVLIALRHHLFAEDLRKPSVNRREITVRFVYPHLREIYFMGETLWIRISRRICSISNTSSITGVLLAGSFVKPCQLSFARQLLRHSLAIPTA